MPNYDDFIKDVDPKQQKHVAQINNLLTDNGYVVKAELAKNGYVVSYSDKKTKKVIMNFVFRKSGLHVRIYGDFSGHYVEVVEGITENMKKMVLKAPDCKRLLDPAKCNSRCPMGNVFILSDIECKKCRYSCFFFALNDETVNPITELIKKEIQFRKEIS